MLIAFTGRELITLYTQVNHSSADRSADRPAISGTRHNCVCERAQYGPEEEILLCESQFSKSEADNSDDGRMGGKGSVFVQYRALINWIDFDSFDTTCVLLTITPATLSLAFN